MDYTPLADPFIIRFQSDGFEYKAKIVYAKSRTSCANFFDVTVISPTGIAPFCLKEKPVQNSETDSIVWVDQNDKQSIFYQFIGNEITNYLKNELGIYLMDFQVTDEE